MLPYFPFGQRFNDKMGTLPLSESDRLLEVDEHYAWEIGLKRQLLSELPNYYFQALPSYESAQWEVLDFVLHSLIQAYPDQFSLTKQGDQWHWVNRLLAEEQTFILGDMTSLPQSPLDWVGQQVQEDLLLLSGPDGHLVAGQLCFANDWNLDEKIGLPFWQIHAPINDIVEPMMRSAETFMQRLPAGKSYWRANWSVKVSNQLDMSTRHLPALKQQLMGRLPYLTLNTIGDQLYVRVERQILTRLPHSNAVLFSIHTYQNLLANEAADPDRAARMAQVFSTTPPALIDYKSMTDFLPILLAYLRFRG
ncbi:heme-dependent oxidative N-demethylase family protein [Spirosoma gilvum]